MQTLITSDRPRDAVARWRRERLVESGFPHALATRLAVEGRFDLHALIELVEGGCPPDVAVRIVAPVGAEWPGRVA